MNIIFDLDGTLFQTQPCIINAVNKLFLNNGLKPIESDKILQNIGKRSNDFLCSILPPDIITNELYEQFCMYEKEEISQNGQLFDGIQTLLDYLKINNHHLYLCSNGSIE
ncbi:HAD family hydrolase, partial [Anaerosporobacter sp.]